jgi:two-component system sensor histidine kinase KdpD
VVAFVIDALLPVASLSLVFLIAVLIVAVRFGLWPSILASLAAFVVYNFFFTDPHYTFFVDSQEDVLTLVLFLVAAVFTGNLAARLQAQVAAQRAIARRTANLYEFSRKIAIAASLDDVVWAAVHHVASTLQCRSLVLMPDAEARLAIVGGYPPEDRLEAKDWGAATWAWQHVEPAGWSSGTLPTSAWLFLPLETGQGALGMLGVSFGDRDDLAPAERRLLKALVDQVALAIERTRLVADLADARLASETERLRSAVLSSVSHDLRTPLVSIIGSATSLLEADRAIDETGRRQLTELILEEGERLNRYIQNLLDMTRLSHGALELHKDWVDPREIVGRAVRKLGPVIAHHRVAIELPGDPPPLRADPVLLEQVVVNILDNAVKYAPPYTEVRIEGRSRGDGFVLAITDEGPGIPEADRERVFDMFYRARSGEGEKSGTGLGLAICRGIVEAHGGRVRAERVSRYGGTRIEITLPLEPQEATASPSAVAAAT